MENAAFFHSRASGIMAVMILVVVGLYGLHLRTINGTAGDVVQVVGLSFMTLASLANILEKGMSHVVLHTIHFSADTALTYEQAVLFTHHLIPPAIASRRSAALPAAWASPSLPWDSAARSCTVSAARSAWRWSPLASG